jgi:hypothetical protein
VGGVDVIEPGEFTDLLLRLLCDLAAAVIIIRFIYYPRDKRREYLFTFFIFNVLIFFVCSFLKSIIMNIGFAFGLFAIFTILRYRTETIPIREMTYQFLIITLGAINGLVGNGNWLLQLLFINLVIVVFTFILDSNVLMKEEHSKLVLYEKIELIKPEKREELIADLRERTGLDINRIKIEKINFLQDTASITVYYRDRKAG